MVNEEEELMEEIMNTPYGLIGRIEGILTYYSELADDTKKIQMITEVMNEFYERRGWEKIRLNPINNQVQPN